MHSVSAVCQILASSGIEFVCMYEDLSISEVRQHRLMILDGSFVYKLFSLKAITERMFVFVNTFIEHLFVILFQ